MNRDVAVKRLERQHGRDSFRRELTALSAVKHENVLRVLAYNEEGCPDGHMYLVMPYMSGNCTVYRRAQDGDLCMCRW